MLSLKLKSLVKFLDMAESALIVPPKAVLRAAARQAKAALEQAEALEGAVMPGKARFTLGRPGNDNRAIKWEPPHVKC